MISSSDMPVPKRSVREHRPPIERAATSQHPRPAASLTAQLGVHRALAQAERRAPRGAPRRSIAACCTAAGRRDGVT